MSRLSATPASPIPRRADSPSWRPTWPPEVLSPDDRAGEVLAKVADWLNAATQLVWVVDPLRTNARVYRADGSESALGENDLLDGEAVLPGFTCALSYVFRDSA